MRPEAERKLRAGYQRRVDEQSHRHAAQLAHAGQLAARYRCGEVVGVFSARTGGTAGSRVWVAGLLPLAAVPVMIAGVAVGLRGLGALLLVFPFAWGAWFGLCVLLLRTPARWVWCYAFTGAFMLLDDPRAEPVPVRWSQVTEVAPVWARVYDVGTADDLDPRPVLTAYRLRSADGRAHEITRSFRNVQDPYGEAGKMLRTVMPGTSGKIMPALPTIDEIIAAYAVNPAQR